MAITYRILPEVSHQDAARFWANVSIQLADQCWPWIGPVNPWRDSYGRFWIRRVEYRTNRMAYWLHYGVDPGHLDVMHSCDNPPCCNPGHLTAGTRAKNLADMVARGRSCKGEKHRSQTNPELVVKGEAHYKALFTDNIIREIRQRYTRGDGSQRILAIEYGTSQSQVSNIVRMKTWKHVV